MVARSGQSIRRREVSTLLLTEDASTDAIRTIEAVVRRVFAMLVDGYQSQHIGFDPPEKVLRDVLHANRWKEFRKDVRLDHAYRTLLGTITTRLLQPNGFVVFHFDGDRGWSQSATSENAARFDQLIRLPVQREIAARGLEPTTALARLFVFVPFYSIEAWLYQNTRRAIEICQAQYRGADVATFARWEAVPAELDEVLKVKESTCLRDRHNLELARGLDADRVFAVGKSFAASVERLLACDALSEALARTKSA